MDVYALIIAGGVGARFWPRSRERSPKQLLEIAGRGTMLQNTVARLHPLVPQERILIVTNAVQAEALARQVPGIPAANILVEPTGRNTAPAIALGAEVLRHRAGEALLVVLPADHLVQDVAGFQDTLTRALRVAEESRSLVTIGITPTRPETGYGYIQYDDGDPANPFREIGAYPVKTFAEKPSQALARSFIKSGDFLWNAGMFIFRVTALLNAVAEQLPDMADEFHRLRPFIDEPGFGKALDQAYRRMHAISIDYGIMEKADNRYILPADFGWNDLGSWDEVFAIAEKDGEGNATRGAVVLTNTERCHVSASDGQVVAAVGMKDAIIIATPDAVLVCHTGDSQAVKEVVDHLRKQGMDSFL